MASRQYRRNRSGQFASAGDSGARITTGRAGGFANSAFRNRVASNRANQAASKRRRAALVRKGVKVAGAAAAAGATGAVMRRGVKSSPTGSSLGSTVRKVVTAVRGN